MGKHEHPGNLVLVVNAGGDDLGGIDDGAAAQTDEQIDAVFLTKLHTLLHLRNFGVGGDAVKVDARNTGFGKALLTQHIQTCVVNDIRDGKTETVEELVETLGKMMK